MGCLATALLSLCISADCLRSVFYRDIGRDVLLLLLAAAERCFQAIATGSATSVDNQMTSPYMVLVL